MYDIDLWDTSMDTIAALKQAGKKVICYFRYNLRVIDAISSMILSYLSAGSYENWRPDKHLFPDSVKGNPLKGWLVIILSSSVRYSIHVKS